MRAVVMRDGLGLAGSCSIISDFQQLAASKGRLVGDNSRVSMSNGFPDIHGRMTIFSDRNELLIS
jgi:hypothetical protein